MPIILTVFMAKLASLASRWLGRGGGSALPGLVAEKLDKKIAQKLVTDLQIGCILVTGTNGKTTATMMLVSILRESGHQVVTNSSGSNLTRGLASALIAQADWWGKVTADLGVFEVDEASMPAASNLLKPKAVVVLNLFRDQLDRYGELDKTADLIKRAIRGLEADIWLNADDPLVASLGRGLDRVHYFGVENSPVQRLQHDFAADSNRCPFDGQTLTYTKNFFGHIGHWRCPKDDFNRPIPQVTLHDLESGTRIESKTVLRAIKLPLPGLYNAYNALAALAASLTLGISIKPAVAALERVQAGFGRVEQINFRGRRLYLLLIKNPTGFNQVIQTFLADEPANLMIAINDNFADGRDVSWLWDVGFEELQLRQPVVATGVRAADLALRLKYGELEASIEFDMDQAINQLVERTPKGEAAYILPTYTAMLEIRRRLKLNRFTT